MPKIRKILQIRQIRNQRLAVSDWLLAHTKALSVVVVMMLSNHQNLQKPRKLRIPEPRNVATVVSVVFVGDICLQHMDKYASSPQSHGSGHKVRDERIRKLYSTMNQWVTREWYRSSLEKDKVLRV